MPSAPRFSARPLENDVSSDSAPNDNPAAKPVGGQAKKPRRRAAPRGAKLAGKTSAERQEIDAVLSSIYKDSNGQLPAMDKINLKKTGSAAKFLAALIIAAAALAGASYLGFSETGGRFSDNEQLALEIQGPAENTLGATTTYIIYLKNRGSSELTAVALNVLYPAGFVFLNSAPPGDDGGRNEWTFPQIAGKDEIKITITGKTYGNLNEEQSWRALSGYRATNFESKLQTSALLKTQIAATPFALTLTGPEQAVVGNTVNYALTVKSANTWKEPLELTPILPANFHIASSSPALNKNGAFAITPSSTDSAWEQTFRFSGQFSADESGSADMAAELNFAPPGTDLAFVVARSAIKTALIKNELGLRLAINGSLDQATVRPGGALNITLNIKNDSPNDVKNGALTLKIDAPALNRQSLLDWNSWEDKLDGDVKGIQLDDHTRRGQVVWTDKQIKELADLKSGAPISVDVSLPVKTAEQINLGELTGHVINATAELTVTDQSGRGQTVVANPVTITVNSDLDFANRHKIGADNRHEFTWMLTNNLHELKDVKISAELYGDVSLEKGDVPAGEVVYDESNKKITWNIPVMPLETDVLAWPFKVTIGQLNPTQSVLLSAINVSAQDAVTGQTINFLSEETPLQF